MGDELDTDTLLAILASLVDDASLTQDVLLEALATHGGDVNAAATALKTRPPSVSRSWTEATGASASLSRGVKRKRDSGLESWLKGSRNTRQHSPERKLSSRRSSPGPSPIKAPLSSTSPKKPSVDLMTILRPPPSSSSGPAKIPPLTLGTPALIAQHTPCTLHPRVLPTELASLLFHTMIDEAQKWRRNEWWLFDRLVTSPHRTSFYARKDTDAPEGDAWTDAANTWCAHDFSSIALNSENI
jgi:hypothetical protein